MQDNPVLFVVGSQCHPDVEEKFNKWYNDTHIPMILKCKSVEGATRYKLSPVTQGEYPKYLAIYEFKNRKAFEAFSASADLAACVEEMNATWAGKKIEILSRAVYEPLKSWHK